MNRSQEDRQRLSEQEVERLLASIPEPVEFPNAEREAIWNNLSERLERESSPSRPSPTWLKYALAAAALVLAVLSVNAWQRTRHESRGLPRLNDTSSTALHQWPEGSRMEILPGAEVAWAFDRHSRRVFLYRGEILLDVASESRPLEVLTPNARVRVLGTRFRVNVH